MKNIKFTLTIAISLIFLQSCGIYDLRTKELKKNGLQAENIKKGKMILETAWLKHGMDKLSNFKTYSFHGSDTWKGPLGKFGKVWKDNNSELDFKFRINSFDGQVTFLDGKDKGTSSGLQNWNYYDVVNNKAVFSDKDDKKNERKVFGIAAYQYFSEMIDRLKNAPIISYAGEDELRGNKYHLVICTWDKLEPHLEHDQYMAWVNKESGLMEFVQYTIRESYLKPPGYKKIGGGIKFADFKEIDGVLVPHRQIIYALKLRKNRKKNLHELYIKNFEFDKFDETELQVDKNKPLGDKSK